MAEVEHLAFANPSSPHWAGRDARILLEDSREKLAQALGTKPQEIFFTSGGSESNNTVLRQLLMTSGEKHIISSSVEHPSVLETCRILAEQQNIQFNMETCGKCIHINSIQDCSLINKEQSSRFVT